MACWACGVNGGRSRAAPASPQAARGRGPSTQSVVPPHAEPGAPAGPGSGCAAAACRVAFADEAPRYCVAMALGPAAAGLRLQRSVRSRRRTRRSAPAPAAIMAVDAKGAPADAKASSGLASTSKKMGKAACGCMANTGAGVHALTRAGALRGRRAAGRHTCSLL